MSFFDMPEEEDPDVLADKWGEYPELDNERFLAMFEEEYERDYDRDYREYD